MEINKKISRKTFLYYASAFVAVLLLSKATSKAGAVKSIISPDKSTAGSYNNSVYGGKADV